MNNEQPKILYNHTEYDWDFSCDDLDDAVEIAKARNRRSESEWVTIYSGESRQLKFTELFRFDDFIDLVMDGECEYIDNNDDPTDYENKVTDEQREELMALIQSWADKHDLNSETFTIKNVKAVNVFVKTEAAKLTGD